MSFLETPRLPDEIAFWARGGSGWRTLVTSVFSGREQRWQVWQYPKGAWDVAEALRVPDHVASAYNARVLRDYFHAVRAQLIPFRMKDFDDYTDEGNGMLGTGGAGTGAKTYQMYKNYVKGAQSAQRVIQKPVSPCVFLRNAAPLTVGASPGNISVDYATGLVTFVADDSEAITGHTVGASHQFTTANDVTGLVIGKAVYITGVSGNAATLLNGAAAGSLTITGKTGAGPYTWTVAVNTTGLTASGGTASIYPQASDALTWTGDFDVPVRFATDQKNAGMDPGGLVSWSSIPLVEVRL